MTTVLIVDDEPNIRALIEQALEDLTDEGIELLTASDGDEAIEVVRAREPRLVFLDVMMPKRNGFDVCKAIKTELGPAEHVRRHPHRPRAVVRPQGRQRRRRGPVPDQALRPGRPPRTCPRGPRPRQRRTRLTRRPPRTMGPGAIALGVGASLLVIVYLVGRGPAAESIAIVLAAILPAALVLYGGAARRRSRELRYAAEPDRAGVPPVRGGQPGPHRAPGRADDPQRARRVRQLHPGPGRAAGPLARGRHPAPPVRPGADPPRRRGAAGPRQGPLGRREPRDGGDGRRAGAAVRPRELAARPALRVRWPGPVPRRQRRPRRAQPGARRAARGRFLPRDAADQQGPGRRHPRGRQPPVRPRRHARRRATPLHDRQPRSRPAS